MALAGRTSRALGRAVLPRVGQVTRAAPASLPLGIAQGAGPASFSRRFPGAAVAAWGPSQRRNVSVVAEATPNPESVIFHPAGKEVLGDGMKTRKFTNKYDTEDSPLAAVIFKVRGVSEVLLAGHHITVTKGGNLSWELIQPNVELVISQFYAAGLKPLKPEAMERDGSALSGKPEFEAGSVEAQILELMEDRVRPFVQQDGGDIEFDRFERETGRLYVIMHGACSGCPKSGVTLQHGIKNLMEHYIPEVKEIINVDDEESDSDGGSIPRPREVYS